MLAFGIHVMQARREATGNSPQTDSFQRQCLLKKAMGQPQSSLMLPFGELMPEKLDVACQLEG